MTCIPIANGMRWRVGARLNIYKPKVVSLLFSINATILTCRVCVCVVCFEYTLHVVVSNGIYLCVYVEGCCWLPLTIWREWCLRAAVLYFFHIFSNRIPDR